MQTLQTALTTLAALTSATKNLGDVAQHEGGSTLLLFNKLIGQYPFLCRLNWTSVPPNTLKTIIQIFDEMGLDPKNISKPLQDVLVEKLSLFLESFNAYNLVAIQNFRLSPNELNPLDDLDALEIIPPLFASHAFPRSLPLSRRMALEMLLSTMMGIKKTPDTQQVLSFLSERTTHHIDAMQALIRMATPTEMQTVVTFITACLKREYSTRFRNHELWNILAEILTKAQISPINVNEICDAIVFCFRDSHFSRDLEETVKALISLKLPPAALQRITDALVGDLKTEAEKQSITLNSALSLCAIVKNIPLSSDVLGPIMLEIAIFLAEKPPHRFTPRQGRGEIADNLKLVTLPIDVRKEMTRIFLEKLKKLKNDEDVRDNLICLMAFPPHSDSNKEVTEALLSILEKCSCYDKKENIIETLFALGLPEPTNKMAQQKILETMQKQGPSNFWNQYNNYEAFRDRYLRRAAIIAEAVPVKEDSKDCAEGLSTPNKLRIIQELLDILLDPKKQEFEREQASDKLYRILRKSLKIAPSSSGAIESIISLLDAVLDKDTLHIDTLPDLKKLAETLCTSYSAEKNEIVRAAMVKVLIILPLTPLQFRTMMNDFLSLKDLKQYKLKQAIMMGLEARELTPEQMKIALEILIHCMDQKGSISYWAQKLFENLTVSAENVNIFLEAMLPLLTDRAWNVRNFAAEALSTKLSSLDIKVIDEAKAIAVAHALIFGVSNLYSKEAALKALAKFPIFASCVEKVKTGLFAFLNEFDFYESVGNAVQILCKFELNQAETTLVIKKMLPLLNNEDLKLRFKFMQILKKMVIPFNCVKIIANAMIPLLSDEHAASRLFALEVLGKLGQITHLKAVLRESVETEQTLARGEDSSKEEQKGIVEIITANAAAATNVVVKVSMVHNASGIPLARSVNSGSGCDEKERRDVNELQDILEKLRPEYFKLKAIEKKAEEEQRKRGEIEREARKKTEKSPATAAAGSGSDQKEKKERADSSAIRLCAPIAFSTEGAAVVVAAPVPPPIPVPADAQSQAANTGTTMGGSHLKLTS